MDSETRPHASTASNPASAAGNPTRDLTGLRFGRVTVVARAASTKAGAAQWQCLCDCGSMSIARGTNLTSGHTLSCGCGRSPGRKAPPDAPLHPPRIRIDLYRGQDTHAESEIGFAVMWLPTPPLSPENGAGGFLATIETFARPFLTVPALPRVKHTGPVSVTLARALYELRRLNWIHPQGGRSYAAWMRESGVEVHTVLVASSPGPILAAYANVTGARSEPA